MLWVPVVLKQKCKVSIKFYRHKNQCDSCQHGKERNLAGLSIGMFTELQVCEDTGVFDSEVVEGNSCFA